MARRDHGQLELFAPSRPVVDARDRPWNADLEAIAARLPREVLLGTSSWTFPGWGGLVYPKGVSDARLQAEGLALYCQFPLFRTVGIDRSYYKPLTRDELERYAEQLPDGFECVEKVWDRLLIPVFPDHPRYGPEAGEQNPRFMDAAAFRDHVWRAHEGVFEDHVGAFVLEFPPMRAGTWPTPEAFATRLARFLDALPYGPRFAVELRNPELLTPAYERVLRDRNVAHVYSMWDRMPMPGEQRARIAPTADFSVSRLLLRPGTTYDERKDAFAPFDRIQDPNEELRSDLVALAKEAVLDKRRTFIVVNNKAEGSAPLTVAELARRIALGT